MHGFIRTISKLRSPIIVSNADYQFWHTQPLSIRWTYTSAIFRKHNIEQSCGFENTTIHLHPWKPAVCNILAIFDYRSRPVQGFAQVYNPNFKGFEPQRIGSTWCLKYVSLFTPQQPNKRSRILLQTKFPFEDKCYWCRPVGITCCQWIRYHLTKPNNPLHDAIYVVLMATTQYDSICYFITTYFMSWPI